MQRHTQSPQPILPKTFYLYLRAASTDAAGEGVVGVTGAGTREVSYRLMFIACSAQVSFRLPEPAQPSWQAAHREYNVGLHPLGAQHLQQMQQRV